MKTLKNFENQVIKNLQAIKGGADSKRKSRFRSRDRKYKEKSGCVTMNVYCSNGGDD